MIFCIFTCCCIQIHESNAESTLPVVHIEMGGVPSSKVFREADKDSIQLAFCAATVVTNLRVSQ